MSRIRVLVVDDSFLVQEILKEMLASDDQLEVIGTADNGKIGVEKALSMKPDLVTMDINMPVMNGLELLRELRADASFKDTKIMMVTAHNNMDDVVEAMQSGADDFLMKPLTEEMFIDKMRVLGLTN